MKKVLILFLTLFIVCGCSKKTCIKSHEELQTYLMTRCTPNGINITCIPVSEIRLVDVCDKWEEKE